MNLAGRTRLRLRLRDLSATAAFLSIALSGNVPPWALVAFSLALLVSLAGRRPLANRTVWSAVLLLVCAVALFGAAFRGALDLVVAACTFAALVTAHRILSSPSTGTDQQVHLTSLLMIAGGAALSGELWFGACLAAFAVTSTLSLALGVLEGPSPDEEVALTAPLRQLTAGVLLALAGGMVFFVFFPRLSWNFAAHRTPPGLTGGTTGMSDKVRLGGAGNLKTSSRVVARVRLTPEPRLDRLDAYFVGRTFDAFDGREWSGRGTEKSPRGLVRVGEMSVRAVRQQIELLPAYESRTLIALEAPVTFGDATYSNASGSGRALMAEVPGEEVHFVQAANAYSYVANSVALDSRPVTASPRLDDVARFTSLPDNLDPRVAALAAQIVGGETRPQAAAARLSRYLQSNYEYSLELNGEAADPLSDFLFVRKAGHCEHFATALTVMLRSQGFAARVAAGFFGGEKVADRFVLRAGDAHAWTQAWVPGTGWQTFDATPDSGRGSQPVPLLAWLSTRYEELENWWRARVVDYTLQDQVDLARALVRPPRAPVGGALPSGPPREAWFAALGVGVLVYVVSQVLWRRRRHQRPHAMASFLDEIERRLARAGVAREDDEPLEELNGRLRESAHPLAPAVSAVTAAYLAARFGGRPLERAERARLLEQLTRKAA